jgi:filamentous hemagglutinin
MPGSATKDLLVRGGGTGVRVDVVGPKGELIAVGGPSKAGNLGGVGSNLTRLATVAKAKGVRALAYFEEGTPPEVIALAQKLLGRENVHIFPR